MEGNRVYLAACPDYGQAEAKLREAVAALGGMERFVRPGERILLKANLLRAAPHRKLLSRKPAGTQHSLQACGKECHFDCGVCQGAG